MSEAAQDVRTYPMPRDGRCPFDPPAELGRIRDEEGIVKVVTYGGMDAWLVSGYDEVRALLADDRVSSNPSKPGYPERSASYVATMGNDRTLRTADNPEHDIQKRMIIQDFAIKRVAMMRPTIQAEVDALLDTMIARGTSAELVNDFAFPVPTIVVSKLLGVPHSDHPFFSSRASTVLSHVSTAEEAVVAAKELHEYLDRLIDIKQADPADDMVSRLTHDQLNPGNLTRQQVIEISRQMVLAGYDTTAHGITLSVTALLQNADVLQDLLENMDEPGLLANAVDELMRYLSVTHTGRRRAITADIEIGGQLLRAGEGLIIANNLADRDGSIFPEPERIDIRRSNAKANVAFGYGTHQCPGQALSRAELQIVHGTIWRRLPGLRLAVPFEELRFRESDLVYGLHELPVTWDA